MSAILSDTIAAERQRITTRLEKVTAEKADLETQLNEFFITERTLTRFAGASPAKDTPRRRGRPPLAKTPTPITRGTKGKGASGSTSGAKLTLSDYALQAVQARSGLTAGGIATHVNANYNPAKPARPNHIGAMLKRLALKGQVVKGAGDTWYIPTTMAKTGTDG